MTTAHKPAASSTQPFHDATVRVRYAETDQMGVVYHANYLIWMEVGRVELLRSLGVEYKQMETADDCHIVVVEAHCRYLKSARYDEVLRIRTRVSEARSRSIHFHYEIWRDADQQLLATGETRHVICGKDGRPKHLPEKYRSLFSAAAPATVPA
ncbi:MAG TPA: thioesterase family protein [Candidatus Acidoferrum sp.]|nr:thioesterase family protein [Candidatus Acidoferrum sp.]